MSCEGNVFCSLLLSVDVNVGRLARILIIPVVCQQVQRLLGLCADHLEKGESHQAPAVLGIALVAMAEELGLDMAIRSLEHLLQYGEQNIRRAVPLALGILSISNPKV